MLFLCMYSFLGVLKGSFYIKFSFVNINILFFFFITSTVFSSLRKSKMILKSVVFS